MIFASHSPLPSTKYH